MTIIVGIRFKDSGKTYYFDPCDLTLHQGDMVIVDTARGPEMAKVVYGRCDVPDNDVVGELKPVLRHAEPSDFERMHALQKRHEEVLLRCAEKVKQHNLPMDLVKAEYSFDGSRLTFYFVSEQRVDFRMLVRDLARTFRSRIELRQIGPRDEAKLLGGIGPCGRLLCCATFLPDYARVSIKMAKDQDLPLNPSKISGVCGRLLCCLSYEHQQYVDMKAELPNKGDWVQTPDGPGDVIAVNVLKAAATVRLAHSGMEEEYTTAQIQQASAEVKAVAHQRKRAGITPATNYEQDDEAAASELMKLLEDDTETLTDYTLDEETSPRPKKSERRKPSSRSSERSARSKAHQSAAGAEAPRPTDGSATPSDSPDKPSRSSRRRRKRKPKQSASQTEQQAQDKPTAQTTQSVDDAGKTQPDQQASSSRSKKRRRKRKPKSKPTEEG